MSHHDVIVVGTGLAGLSAALRLAEDGARVLVLAKGIGATHLSPGTIDVLGYAPERVDRPAEAIGALVDARPDHPYALVGATGVAAAVDWFKAASRQARLPHTPTPAASRKNFLLPTAVGPARPSAVVPETMSGGDLRRDAPICVVGLRALKDFHPALAADTLTRAGIQARSVELDLVPEGRADVNALGFARAFDDPAFRAEVTAQVIGQLGVEERAAFPAVLGIADPHGALGRARAPAWARGVRDPHPSAVRARHAGPQEPARGAAPCGWARDPQRRRHRSRARGRAG